MPEETREVRFLTMQEICIQLRISPHKARRLLNTKFLAGMKVPGAGGKHGQWRIVDPGPKFERWLREEEEHRFHVPLLSLREVADITGLTYNAIRCLVARGKIKSAFREGKRREHRFTVAEVRRLIRERELLVRPGKKTVQLRKLVEWGKSYLEELRKESAENTQDPVKDQLAEALANILELPQPERTQSLLAFFNKVDGAGLLLDTVRKSGNLPQ